MSLMLQFIKLKFCNFIFEYWWGDCKNNWLKVFFSDSSCNADELSWDERRRLFGSIQPTRILWEQSRRCEHGFNGLYLHTRKVRTGETLLDSCRCKSGTCNLHMHFHGCGMGRWDVIDLEIDLTINQATKSWFRFFIDDNYIRNSGMMETADLYDVILLLPQVFSPSSAIIHLAGVLQQDARRSNLFLF